MRQARTVLSTYSADTFGVCSGLYELGGMIVMHDASGCNSTYSTHDEPRWYQSDSLVFISGLTEMDAIMGNDEKLKEDILSAVSELHPKFVAIAGTPIPMMNGFDFEAVAKEIESEAGIPVFGFSTNGMRSYLCGASEALEKYAERMVKRNVSKEKKTLNILGATPLDFSLSGTVESVKKLLSENGWEVLSTFAMGSTAEEIANAGKASVNLVISGVGMKSARRLNSIFETPYVIGTPVGKLFAESILEALAHSAEDGQNRIAFSDFIPQQNEEFLMIGESIISRSLAAAVFMETGRMPVVVYPLEKIPELDGILSERDIYAMEEEEISLACRNAKTVIADPLYKPVLPHGCRFIPLPHEAFSGRIFRRGIPDLTEIDVKEMMGE